MILSSESASVLTGYKIEGSGARSPGKKMNFRSFTNAVLERLHYYRCRHYNTHIQVDKQKPEKS